ncbi:MAG TPA: sigma-70 family RNA polymerase sigma factor [Ktedonobacterales bacterium]|nr:sigma-70 family RNA polymerase sigma factor [Ktedonobacterales bacterium]
MDADVGEEAAIARPEVAAFRRLRATGDAALKQEIFDKYHWLVEHMLLVLKIRDFSVRGWTRQDLEQQGAEGLVMAINEYDPDGRHRNTRFHTLVSWRVADALRSGLGPDIVPPLLSLEFDIADAPTITMPIVQPLQAPAWLVGNRETTQPLPILRELEQMAAPGPTVEEQVATAVDGAQVSLALEQALQHLDSRQRFVIERRYGLVGDQHVWTQEELGHALSIHRSNVCRTQQKALAVLRAHLQTAPDGAVILRSLDERRQQRSKKRATAA